MHKLLEKQLKKLSKFSLDGEIDYSLLMEMVSASYEEADQERKLTDRSISLMAQELLELNQKVVAQSEARIHAIVNNVGDGIVTIDEFGTIETVNLAVQQIFGYKTEELIGKNVNILMPQPYKDEHDTYLKNYKETKVAKIIGTRREITGLRKDGTIFPLELAVSELVLGEKLIFIGVVRDITERKKAENNLRETTIRFSSLIENLQAGILVENEFRKIILANDAFCSMFAIPVEPKFLVGMDCSNSAEQSKGLFYDSGLFVLRIDEILEEQKVVVAEELKLIDGRIFERDYVPIFVNGDYRGHLWQYRDITERKKAEAELHKQDVLLQGVAEATNYLLSESDYVLIINRVLAILGTSTSADRVFVFENHLLPMTKERVCSQKFEWTRHVIPSHLNEKKFQNMKHSDLGLARWEELFETGEIVCGSAKDFPESERIFLEEQGILSILVLPIFVENEFWGFIGFDDCLKERVWSKNEMAILLAAAGNIGEAITKKRAKDKLIKALREAESANRSKSEFLANMSHEIRTPLNAIIGMTELALDTHLSYEQQGFLRVVQSSSEALLRVINDILDFSKIEAGQMEFEEISFELREVVEGVAEVLSIRTHEKNVELVCYVEPKIPNFFIGDPNRLRQILMNLVGNAIKFTNEGEIVIKVLCEGRTENNKANLRFVVSDTGIGIPKDKQEKIFEKFSQADTSTTRRFGGTGLGLSISKSLVELMGGKIQLESEVGKGSVFYFNLELNISDENKVEFDYPNFENISILVVDDNHTNLFILDKILSAWNFKVEQADSGKEAINFLENEKYDLVILDHQMPEMDGVQVVQKIRENEKIKDLKIIILSSWGGLKSNLIKNLGVAYSLTKPIKQSNLFNILLEAFRMQKSNNSDRQDFDAKQVARKRVPKKVLLAEDNVDNQNLAVNILKKAGFVCDLADNGEIAVKLAEKFNYDLVLMDIQMPVMDGFSATRIIRFLEQSQNRNRTPVIALTAHAMTGYREKCLDNDMDGYITKPIKRQSLLEIIENYLDLRYKILVVDDSVDNCNLIANYLKKDENFRLIFANNGKEALKIFTQQTIDLILLDMEMPILNGYETAETIRKNEQDYQVPIIALTAHQGVSEIKKCLDAGCSDYVSKPVRKPQLLETIKKYL